MYFDSIQRYIAQEYHKVQMLGIDVRTYSQPIRIPATPLPSHRQHDNSMILKTKVHDVNLEVRKVCKTHINYNIQEECLGKGWGLPCVK